MINPIVKMTKQALAACVLVIVVPLTLVILMFSKAELNCDETIENVIARGGGQQAINEYFVRMGKCEAEKIERLQGFYVR